MPFLQGSNSATVMAGQPAWLKFYMKASQKLRPSILRTSRLAILLGGKKMPLILGQHSPQSFNELNVGWIESSQSMRLIERRTARPRGATRRIG